MKHFLIYGANGYSGELIAREAQQRGLQPILAGRSGKSLQKLAQELNLEWRVASLDDLPACRAMLEDVAVVLNCAGPFSRTAHSMVEACLAARVHYLDITGEYDVIESLAERDREFQRAGIMVLPAAGFDVVPSDCLAAYVRQRLPSATHLTLALSLEGHVSRGTAITIVENMHRGGVVRNAGQIVKVPTAWKTRRIPFPTGPRTAVLMPIADVASAFHSTGIPNIEAYIVLPAGMRFLVRSLRWFTGWLSGSRWQEWLKTRIAAGKAGPTVQQRAVGHSLLWAEARNNADQSVAGWLRGPEAYTFTQQAALAIIARILNGDAPPGFQTPARAYGPDLVLDVPGVQRGDDVQR